MTYSNQESQMGTTKPQNLIVETQGVTNTIDKQVDELNEIITNLNQAVLGSARPLISESEESKKMSLGYVQDHLQHLRKISENLNNTMNQTKDLRKLFLEK